MVDSIIGIAVIGVVGCSVAFLAAWAAYSWILARQRYRRRPERGAGKATAVSLTFVAAPSVSAVRATSETVGSSRESRHR
jgi:hypothetical protein